ncbi:high mobility group protein, related, partial [Halteromyces radiatus]|uniref:high mobility group protein, related n=1 Tax=Halteromyces radiatus TaxID=101107 RepID=UPI002220F184
RKKKKHKNPFGPKHPMSGFLFFASFARPDAVRQYPKSNVGMISKVIAEQWRKMTDDEKYPWQEKAKADKARYAREMEA